MVAEYGFDLYPALDPAGKISGTGVAARLARLTVGDQLAEREGDNYYLHVGHGIGWGRIRIHADDPDIAFVEQRGYVNVRRIDVGPEEDLGGFFLEEGDFLALSEDEQGGRILTFEGPSGLFILDRYSLGHAVFADGQDFRGDFNVVDYWTWANEPPGAILLRGIEEGRDHPDAFFEAVDVDFTRTRDSNDLLWGAERQLAEYATPIQTSILDLYEDMVLQALVVQATGDLTIRAFRSINEFRTDRSGAAFGAGVLRFEEGENIAIEVPQKIHASVKRTHVLIRDRTGDYQTVDEDLDGDPLPGPPYMDTMRSDTTAADDTIIRMGQMRLTARQLLARQAVVRHVIGDDPSAGLYNPSPVGDYWVLDIGTVHTGTSEHDLDEADLEVAAIKILHDDAGNWLAEAQMGAQQIPERAESFQASGGGSRVGRVLRLCTPRQVEPQEEIGGISVTGDTLTLPDDLPDGALEGHWIVGQVARDNGTGIPTIPAGITAIGTGGGTSTGSGGSVAYRMWKRQLTAGDVGAGNTYVFTDGLSLVGVVLDTGGVDPQGAFDDDSIDGAGASGTVFRVPALTLNELGGKSRVLLMGHHNADSNVDNGTLDDAELVASARGGEHAAWLTALRTAHYPGDSFAVSPSGGWQSHAIEVLGSEIVGIEGPQANLAGESEDAAHCDHAHHWISVDEPTPDEDEAHGYPIGTRWLVVDTLPGPTDVLSRWDHIADGVWVEHTGGGGGAALDVQEEGVSVEDPVDEINFGPGFDVSSPGAGRVLVVLDLTEITIAADGVSIADAGGIYTATQVEAALQEVMALVLAHIVDTTDAHDASSISIADAGNLFASSDEVEEALQALAGLGSGLRFRLDNQASVLPTGFYKAADLIAPFDGVITGWKLVADQSSSIVLDVWVDDAHAPTVADTITASDKPTLSSAIQAEDLAPTGWTTAFSKGDVFRINVDSVTGTTGCTLVLYVRKTVA